MATIYRNDTSTSSINTAVPMFIADLTTAYEFKRIDGDKYYITDNTYIEITNSGSSVTITANNGTVTTNLISLSTFLYEIIKTDSGDVLVRADNSSMIDNRRAKFGIISTINQISNTESAAIVQYSDSAGVPMYMIDDSTTSLQVVIGSSTPTSQTYSTYLYAIYNPASPITLLVNTFSMSTAFVGKNTFVMLISPRMYTGECIISGKKYYCLGATAMLDE